MFAGEKCLVLQVGVTLRVSKDVFQVVVALRVEKDVVL